MADPTTNHPAEEAIVRHIARDPSVVDGLIRKDVSRRWFSDPLYASIVEAAIRLRLSGRDIDPLSIMSFSNNGVPPHRWPELMTIWKEPDPPGEWATFIEPLQTSVLLRDFDEVIDEAGRLRSKNPTDVQRWVPYLMNSLQSITQDKVYDARPSAHFKGEVRDVVGKIGVPHLDRFLKGGLWQASVSLFIGISNHGKSTLAYTIAAKLVEQGIRTVFVTTEMTPKEVDIGILRPLANLSDRQIRLEQVSVDHYLEQMDKVMAVYDYHYAMPEDLNRVIYWERPTVVIYDYLKAPEESSHYKREDQVIAALGEGLRTLALDHGVCMLVFGQFSDAKAEEFRRNHNISNPSVFGSTRVYHQVDQLAIMMRHWSQPDTGFFKVKKDKLPPTYIETNLMDWEFTLRHDTRTRSFWQQL